jgi:hypothetical protein
MGSLKMSESRIHVEGLKPADVALLKNVASEAAEQAVNKTLVAMGFDPSRPFEAQKDAQWIRATRERCEGTVGKAVLTIVGLLILGGCTALWTGFKAMLPGGHP